MKKERVRLALDGLQKAIEFVNGIEKSGIPQTEIEAARDLLYTLEEEYNDL